MLDFNNPFVYLLEMLADLLGGNFGFAIMTITLIFRFLLLPLFIQQEKQQKETMAKMEELKPEFTALQEKMSNASTQEEKIARQLELFGLYKKHKINPKTMGFVPALLQAPIFIGLYSALNTSDILQNHPFLWFELSSSDVSLAFIVATLYFLQFKVSEKLNPESRNQPKKKNAMIYIFPLIMLIISVSMPAGVSLYWATGTLFMIGYKLIRTIKKRS